MGVDKQMIKGLIAPVLLAISATLIGIALAIILSTLIAYAHDSRRPDLIPWYNKLQSGKGVCCDGHEAMHLRIDKWKTQDGHYVVEIPRSTADFNRAMAGGSFEAVWVDVPDEAVIKEPNLDGSTLVWPFYIPGDRPGIRCFMPGTFT